MTIRYASKHGANLVNTLNAIRAREPFNAGNLTGTDDYFPPGRLPHAWVDSFYWLNDEPTRPLYAVYSYGTPIAWVTASGEWVVPDVKYSPTTTNHQSVVRSALGGYGHGLVTFDGSEYSHPESIDYRTEL